MKEILIAENSGFCFGVKQAIEKTEEQIKIKEEYSLLRRLKVRIKYGLKVL